MAIFNSYVKLPEGNIKHFEGIAGIAQKRYPQWRTVQCFLVDKHIGKPRLGTWMLYFCWHDWGYILHSQVVCFFLEGIYAKFNKGFDINERYVYISKRPGFHDPHTGVACSFLIARVAIDPTPVIGEWIPEICGKTIMRENKSLKQKTKPTRNADFDVH